MNVVDFDTGTVDSLLDRQIECQLRAVIFSTPKRNTHGPSRRLFADHPARIERELIELMGDQGAPFYSNR